MAPWMTRSLRRLALGLVLVLMPAYAFAVPPVYRLSVDGLACPFCAYGIEKQLSRLDGVEAVDVDIKDGAVRVTLAEGGRLDEATARAAVKRAGFSLRAFEALAAPAAGQ
jgi:copper chaperone CopZ